MAEPRRVRTQAERDADGHTWRAPSFEDMLADPHRQFDPDDELLPHIIAFGTVRDDRPWLFNPTASTTTVTLDNSAGRFLPDPGRGLSPVARVMAGLDRPDRWQEPPPADRSWIEMEIAPPRRRWWHRLTRRNP